MPAGGGAGSPISVTDTTTNQGGGAAPASATRFYLSVDYSWSANDTLLGSRTVPALAAGAASTATTSLTIPAGTAAGTWYVLARADAELAVPEADEGNNVTARPIQLGADLVFFALTVPPAGAPGGSITVSDTVRNQGGGVAGASTTRFYLSADGVLDASDLVLGGRPVPALAGGESHAGSTVLALPAGVAAGQYYLWAKADGDEVVAEVIETNNRAFGLIQIGSDLVVTTVTVPPAGGAGSTVTVGDTTRNQAGAGAAASTTRFYLSANSTWTRATSCSAAGPSRRSRREPARPARRSSPCRRAPPRAVTGSSRAPTPTPPSARPRKGTTSPSRRS